MATADSTLRITTAPKLGNLAYILYFVAVGGMVVRIALLDEWSAASWGVLLLFVTTVSPDRVAHPSRRSLAAAALFFGALSAIVAYVPDLWFGIAYHLNHAEHYLWNANRFMASVPLNDGRFLAGLRSGRLLRFMQWIYLTGFDMVVWIPVVRSLAAFDAKKTARYALAAHVIQFPLIIPFYSAFRVDEVWSVLGDPDRCARGWSDEVRLDLGANCFPSMHTSVAFAIMLLARREKSRLFRTMMYFYGTSIIFSTMFLEIHWLIDVAGGLLLGAVAVKLADPITDFLFDSPLLATREAG